MSIPSISELELAASKIVWNAKKRGNLKEYTTRLVRTTLEDQFHLDQGTLDAAEYKSAIKAATNAALREDPPPGVGEKSPRVEKAVLKKKRKSDGTIKGVDDEKPKYATVSSPKGKAKAKGVKKNDDEEEDEGSLKKRRKTVLQKKKVVSEDDNASSSRPKQRQAQKEKQFKSLELVPTSDMEQDEPTLNDEKPRESASSSPKVTSNRPAPPKKDTVTTPKASKGKEPVRVPQNGDLPVDDLGAKSESELSVLIDEPPKVRRRSKSESKSEGKEPKKRRVKKETPTLSKDEERIKRLKSFVVACGVRKVWSRLFQGLDTPQQQIKKLEEILTELGMRGRMTMDQAKAIKQKRELAKELEDVQEFAKAVEAKDRKNIKALRKIVSSDSEEEKAESNDDEDEESDMAPKKRLMTARKSISAFLRDQSSDE